MKRIFAFFLALSLAAALCACAKPAPETSDPNGVPGTATDQTNPGAASTPGNGTANADTDTSGSASTDVNRDPVAGSDGLEVKYYEGDNMMITGTGSFTGTELVIPSHADGNPVVLIDEDAFAGAQIVTLTVPWTVQWIGEDAFEGCEKLETVTLSEGNISIGEGSFSGCKELKSVVFPSTTERVERSAFRECWSLKEVSFQGGTSLGSYAFAACRSLKSVVFNGNGNTPYSIASEAFSNASALESVTFSKGLTEIGSYCFEGCPNLKTVYFAGSEEEWKAIPIGSSNEALQNAQIVYNYKK